MVIDLTDISSNKYHNNEPIEITLELSSPFKPDKIVVYDCTALIKAGNYNALYGDSLNADFYLPAHFSINEKENKYGILLKTNDETPPLWKEIEKDLDVLGLLHNRLGMPSLMLLVNESSSDFDIYGGLSSVEQTLLAKFKKKGFEFVDIDSEIYSSFSDDLKLSWEKMILYYRLRFQIEFTFRDAKQFWGLEDFMNTKKQGVENAANLSMFMVNLSRSMIEEPTTPIALSIHDLKAKAQAEFFMQRVFNMNPEIADMISFSKLKQDIYDIGCIHSIPVAA